MRCKGKRHGVQCVVNVNLVNNEWVELGVCSQECYSSQFVPSEFTEDPQRRPCPKCGWAHKINHECPAKPHSLHQGLRYNEGKERLDLIPPRVLWELGKHYTYGANKYHDNNWLSGFPYSETYGSLTRHLFVWWGGETNDPESGHHHLVAVLWNVIALFYFELFPSKYKKFDDRPWVWEDSGPEKFNPMDVLVPELEPEAHILPVKVPSGYVFLRTGERIPQTAMYLANEATWIPVPTGWVTTAYEKAMGPIIAPYTSQKIKLPATEIRK